jgi:hypothetical protein
MFPPGLICGLDDRMALGYCQWCRERMVGKILDDAEVQVVLVRNGAVGPSIFALDGTELFIFRAGPGITTNPLPIRQSIWSIIVELSERC